MKGNTEEEFVEIVVNVLDKEEGIDRDIALLIADGVYNRLKSSNIRECVRIARLARNDPAQVDRIVDTFAKYDGMTGTSSYQPKISADLVPASSNASFGSITP